PRQHLHAHPRAILSCVLYLQLPDELVDLPQGGTGFRDPNAGPTSYMAGRPWQWIAARPLDLLVFPSWVEHAPGEAVRPGPYTRPRIVIATDVTCI
ncbi:MAG TPA: putative 2OG-Fe(II) oxygenase, partial [Aquihabitans sp.]|nr:putative 2OG-Fe(II) oxygenase [Aquihabitans sp.]